MATTKTLNVAMESVNMNKTDVKILSVTDGEHKEKGLFQLIYFDQVVEAELEGGHKHTSKVLTKAKVYGGNYKKGDVIPRSTVEVINWGIDGQTHNEIRPLTTQEKEKKDA